MTKSRPSIAFVTPAKAGGQLLLFKFLPQGLDSRLRGNDEVLGLKGLHA
jgi:hypothetical protein